MMRISMMTVIDMMTIVLIKLTLLYHSLLYTTGNHFSNFILGKRGLYNLENLIGFASYKIFNMRKRIPVGGGGGEGQPDVGKDTKVQTVNLKTRNSNEPIAKQHFT